MKNKIREMLESIVPVAMDCGEPHLLAYRKDIINALADGAELVYSLDDLWGTEKDSDDEQFAIRLKPHLIEQQVTKSEIVKQLRDYPYADRGVLADRIELYGIKDGE